MNENKIAKPQHQDWSNIQNKIWTSKGLRRTKRIEAWLHGFSDGIRGLVKIDDGVVSGPYSTQMLQAANENLNVEWKNCGCDMDAFVAYLDYQQGRFNKLMGLRETAVRAGAAAATAARGEVRDGDRGIGEALVSKRRERRAAKASAPFDQRRSKLDAEISALCEDAAEPLRDYYARERISLRNEECIRCESAQKFAVYSRAACGFFSRVENKKAVRDVASVPLTDAPRIEHMNRYRRYAISADESGCRTLAGDAGNSQRYAISADDSACAVP